MGRQNSITLIGGYVFIFIYWIKPGTCGYSINDNEMRDELIQTWYNNRGNPVELKMLPLTLFWSNPSLFAALSVSLNDHLNK